MVIHFPLPPLPLHSVRKLVSNLIFILFLQVWKGNFARVTAYVYISSEKLVFNEVCCSLSCSWSSSGWFDRQRSLTFLSSLAVLLIVYTKVSGIRSSCCSRQPPLRETLPAAALYPCSARFYCIFLFLFFVSSSVFVSILIFSTLIYL